MLSTRLGVRQNSEDVAILSAIDDPHRRVHVRAVADNHFTLHFGLGCRSGDELTA